MRGQGALRRSRPNLRRDVTMKALCYSYKTPVKMQLMPNFSSNERGRLSSLPPIMM